MHITMDSGTLWRCSSVGHRPDRAPGRFLCPAIPSVLCSKENPSFSRSSRSNRDLARPWVLLMVEACSRRRPLPLVAFLLRTGSVPGNSGDSNIGVERSDSADESRFNLLTRLPSEDVREIAGARSKETVFCRVRASGRLSIDGVVADRGVEVSVLAEDMPLIRNSFGFGFDAAPLIVKPLPDANTGVTGCESCMDAGDVTN